MQVLNLNPEYLVPGWFVHKLDPARYSTTFVLKAVFRLQPSGAAIPWDEDADSLSGTVYTNGDPKQSVRYESDFAPFKPRCDVLLVGNAYAPADRPVAMLLAKLRVGDFVKTLAVFGDRAVTFDGDGGVLVAAPKLFLEKPLSYESACGGPEFSKNPVGVTYDSGFLPSIEDPRYPIRDPRAHIDPVGFGPLAGHWEPRRGLTGTYDSKWLNERWPWFPEDFDFSHFNAAPHDQQLNYLRGDEQLEFENLHPKYPVYRSQLPGERARCFVNERQPAGDLRWHEVPLNLDTVWLEPAAEKVILIWRGVISVRSIGLREIEDLLVLMEPLADTPQEAAHYFDLMHRKRQEEAAEFLVEEEDTSEADAAADSVFAEMDEEATAVDQEYSQLEAIVAAADAEQNARMTELGIEPTMLENPHSADQTLSSLKSAFTAAMAQLRQANPDHAAQQPNLDFSEFEQMDLEMERTGETELTPTREHVEAAAQRRQHLAGQDFTELDLSGLDLSTMSFANATLQNVKMSGAKCVRTDFTGADLTGADLSDVDLTDAVLNGADLTGANLSNARLTRVAVAGADLSGLNLVGAHFVEASGRQCDFTRANLEGACFRDAKLPGADFSECQLSNADFAGAELPETDFQGAQARGIKLEGADLTAARAGDHSDFSGANLKGVRAAGSTWDEAVLDGASFEGAVLVGAQFSSASMQRTVFDRADLTSASFDDAQLQTAVLTNANLLRASFDRADLTGTDLRGSNLYEAGLWESILDGAKLQGANLKGTTLA